MGLLAQLLTPRQRAQYPAHHDYWYAPVGVPSAAGVSVSPGMALTVSAVWACVRILSETPAALPLNVYRRRGTSREEARDHPLWSRLHDQPNGWQTALDWREQVTMWAVLWGNGYSRIIPGPRGPVDMLEPYHPDLVEPERLPGGRLRYQVVNDDGRRKPVNDDEIFHVRGPSINGPQGMTLTAYAREAIGLAQATESYGGRFFSQDARPGGILKHPGRLSDEAAQRLSDTWQGRRAGPANAHKTAVLEEGMDWIPVSMASDEAQFLETREFQVAEIARWFRVPLHMIGETSKTTSWGSGVEQLSIGFVIYTLLPWLKRWESAIRRDLVLAPDIYFVEHVVEGLLRGDSQSRYAAYATGRQWGWLSVNDIRRLENLNPVPGGDAYLQPLNMTPIGTQAAAAEPPARDQQQILGVHYQMMVEDAAARVVRKEVSAMRRIVQKTATSPDDRRSAIDAFYADHAPYVAASLHIPINEAAGWVERQHHAILTDGAAVLESWEQTGAADLAALAMEVTR